VRRSEFGRMLRFEVTRTLRDPLCVAALCAFAIILALGAWLYWRALPPRPQNSRFFGEAYLAALVIGWHAGFARDRQCRFDVYLAANFVSSRTLYFAKVTAALLWLAALSLITFLLATATSAGDTGYAAHYTILFVLASILLVPGLVLVELLLNTRYPVPILLLFLLAVLGIYSRAADVQRLIGALGMDGRIEAVPAVLRSLVALAITVALYPCYQLRLGSGRLAALIDST
jgi:hypothetical protein